MLLKLNHLVLLNVLDALIANRKLPGDFEMMGTRGRLRRLGRIKYTGWFLWKMF